MKYIYQPRLEIKLNRSAKASRVRFHEQQFKGDCSVKRDVTEDHNL